ncbi:hypothetical protein [Streptomyces xantholiticus]|uniref:hypothetical protein n=1 Tax=Streptomyces xantholiticus TaxID=68285 RepID=UPI001674F3D2|nr:hypothetical protein [Streptomyces xantholiticus]GGW60493.1 hypothetical protein GCM10010381_52230 [Streptomyces xantholiticus]
MEAPRQERVAYTVDVQRRGSEGWYSQRISPNWVHAVTPADAAVQAFDRYVKKYGETIASLVAPGSHELQVLVHLQREPAVFPLHGVLEHKVRRDFGRRREAEARLERATDALRASVREAAMAGVRQAHLARISGWSRETLRKLTRRS